MEFKEVKPRRQTAPKEEIGAAAGLQSASTHSNTSSDDERRIHVPEPQDSFSKSSFTPQPEQRDFDQFKSLKIGNGIPDI